MFLGSSVLNLNRLKANYSVLYTNLVTNCIQLNFTRESNKILKMTHNFAVNYFVHQTKIITMQNY